MPTKQEGFTLEELQAIPDDGFTLEELQGKSERPSALGTAVKTAAFELTQYPRELLSIFRRPFTKSAQGVAAAANIAAGPPSEIPQRIQQSAESIKAGESPGELVTRRFPALKEEAASPSVVRNIAENLAKGAAPVAADLLAGFPAQAPVFGAAGGAVSKALPEVSPILARMAGAAGAGGAIGAAESERLEDVPGNVLSGAGTGILYSGAMEVPGIIKSALKPRIPDIPPGVAKEVTSERWAKLTPEQKSTVRQLERVTGGEPGISPPPGFKALPPPADVVPEPAPPKAIKAATEPTSVAPTPPEAIIPPQKAGIASETPPGMKERGFIETVRESPNTMPEVAKAVEGVYFVKHNSPVYQKALEIVEKNPDLARHMALDRTIPMTAEKSAMAVAYSQKLQSEGRAGEAADFINEYAKHTTEAGQGIQILALYDRFTPEGIVRFAAAQLKKADPNLTLNPKTAQELAQMAKELQTMPEGEGRLVATAKMMARVAKELPVGTLKKVAFAQTLAQLLNPKTIIRNLGGNTGFAVLEGVSNTLAVPIDAITSFFTKQRTKVLPRPAPYFLGMKQGLREGARDVRAGIDTAPGTTQLDLPRTPTFKGKVGTALTNLLNYAIRVLDRAAYMAKYKSSIDNQMRALKVKEPTAQMQENAHLDALFATFQDPNIFSNSLTGVKHALNFGQDFGLGDVVLKYPRTPGALLARGMIDYSPLGFIKASKAMLDGLRDFTNQKRFSEATARALVGTTGLMGVGYGMRKLGIITGHPEKDRDINALERATGLGLYRLNVSALKRFALTGFTDSTVAKLQPGDRVMTYDWFQPQAIALSLGANLYDNKNTKTGGIAGTLAGSLSEGVNTLVEQPLVSGVRRMFQGQDPFDSIAQSLEGVPASFVPTLLSQIRQYSDNAQRETYDPNPIRRAANYAKMKIPGVAGTLPQRYGTFGQPLESYQGGNNSIINVFLNPAFTSKYTPTPETDMVLDIYNQTGETKQAPRLAPRKIKINGEMMTLTGKQIQDYQKYTGDMAKVIFNGIERDVAGSPYAEKQVKPWALMDNDERADILKVWLDRIASAGKQSVLGDQPKKVNTATLRAMAVYEALKPQESNDGFTLEELTGGR